MRQGWALFTAMALGACQSGAMNEPEPGAGSGPSPRVGGSTSDFGGRCLCELTTRELSLNEVDPVLGFSAEDVLSRLEGEYALAIVWGDACADESPTAEGCADEPPDFMGSETQVRIAIERSGTAARIEECSADASTPECPIASLFVPVVGTLATTDGLLDETFELELQAKSVDEITVGQRILPAQLDGSLPSSMPEIDHLEWTFRLTPTHALFEVSAVVQYSGTSRSRARAVAPEDGQSPDGHSAGVAVDLERARQ